MKKILSALIAICMIVCLLPVIASAADEGPTVSIVSDAASGGMQKYTLNEGDTIYLVNNDAGAANEMGASEDNYTIMLDYPVDGVPTVYLNGATLKSAKIPLVVTGTADVEDFTLVVEADSELTGVGAGIRATNTNLTIIGEGKLTIDAKKGYGIHGYTTTTTDQNKETKHSLTFEEANVDVSLDNSEGGWGVGVGGTIANITIDGGNVAVSTVGKAAGMYSMNGDLLITGGANLEVTVEDQVGLSAFTSILQESGHLKIKTLGEGAPGISGCKDIKVTGGTVDINGPAVAYGKIDLDEYEGDYTAIVCQSKDGKGGVPYNPEEQNLGYFYIFQLTLGSSYEVNVKNGTTDKSVAAPDETITITARIAPEGKAFDKWEVNNGTITLADPTESTTTFTMPAENVKITALYKDVETEDEPEDDPVDDPVDTPDDTTDNTTTNTPDDTTTESKPSQDDANKNETNKKPAKKQSSGITALLLVLIIVVSVGIGAAAVILFLTIKNKKSKTEEEPEAETEEPEAPAEDAE